MNMFKVLFFTLWLGMASMVYAASNNPTVSFSPLNVTVSEGTGNVTVTFTLSISEAPTQKDVVIAYATVSGTAVSPTNFTATSGSVTFVKNAAPVNKTFSVVVKTDAVISSNVSFSVHLENVTNAAQDVTLQNTDATITILNIAPPTVVDDTATVEINKFTLIDVLANDIAGNNPINPATVAATDPLHGSIAIDPVTGEITYTPDADYVGSDSFQYNVKDTAGTVSDTNATVSISVTYPIPIAYDKIYAVQPGATITGNVITDSPISYNVDDNLTMNANTVPALGTLNPATIPSTGAFTYTAPGTTGTTSFTYSIKNDYGMISNTATVTFYINTYCATAKTLLSTDANCSTIDTNSTSSAEWGGVTSSGAQYFKIVLAEDGVLDINLTNTDPQTGGTILYYDFGDTCGTIFGQNTTSQLDAGFRSKSASMLLSAGTYYLGLQGKSNTNPTDYNVSVAFRSSCAGGTPVYPFVMSSVGINEPGVDYDVDKNITTKIVDKDFGLHASYLDSNGLVDTYDGSYGSGKTVDMTVIVAQADGDTCSNAQVIGQGIIQDNHEDTIITPLSIASASQNKRIKITAFDFGQLFTDASGLNCGSSSLNSSLCLVPACFNNVQNIRSVFPPAFQPGVMTCIYGDGSGLAAPCDSNAYYGNCGGKKLTISPAKYNNDLGCAMCLADAVNSNKCSADNFAIRPNDFNNTIVPDQLFVAGQPVSLTFRADKFAGTGTPQYNETENSSFSVDVNITDTSKVCQQPSINFSPSINFTDGAVTGNYKLNNVGDFNVTMREIPGAEYALVDLDDTNDSERYIVPHTKSIKVIPHHFQIDGNLTNGSNGFTYLSNFEEYSTAESRNISASLDLNVTAKTLDNNTTTNYTEACYAKDGNVTLNLASGISPTPVGNLTKLLWHDKNHDTNGTMALPLAATVVIPVLHTAYDSNESNGTASVNYLLNFDRNQTKVVNPFPVTADSVDADDNDSVHGAKNLNSTVTYVYGRLIPRDTRVFGDTVDALAYGWYELYNAAAALALPLPPSRNEAPWAINTVHDDVVELDGDGMVTQLQTGGGASAVVSPPISGAAVQGMETYDFGTLPLGGYKAHINTDPWLWYGTNALGYVDPVTGNTATNCLTHPCFNITVVPAIGATGSAKTESEDAKASKKSDQGSGWKSTTDYAPAVR